jgi:PleD family two-component response regulator
MHNLIRHTMISFQSEVINVTVTLGGAIIQQDEDLPQLLRRADDRLYQGKEAGRDQIILS